MKIAVLLLVHKNKEQLQRLLSKLKHDNVDIFIHLDSKCSFSSEDISSENVFFTENRYDVGLFEFSMVEAEMELIRTARKHGNYSYYIMMSGQCYPIKSIERIYNTLCERYPVPFIEITAPTETNYVKTNFKHVYILKRFKLKTYAFLKRHFPMQVYSVLRYIPGSFVLLISTIKEVFVKSPQKRLDKLGYKRYCGSQWWILPDKAIDVAEQAYGNEKFCKIIYDTFSCDETFFQTALMLHQDELGIKLDESGDFKNRQWFYNFNGGHPIILTKEKYEEIISSDKLFARKFDDNIDSEILDMIDSANR